MGDLSHDGPDDRGHPERPDEIHTRAESGQHGGGKYCETEPAEHEGALAPSSVFSDIALEG